MKPSKLNVITTTALSLFAIGCLVILLIFVPFWQQQQPAEFLSWFGRHGRTIGLAMIPLEMAPFMLALVTLIKAGRNSIGMPYFMLTNSCNVIILALLIIFFFPLNASFMNSTITLSEVKEALIGWEKVHIIRTALAFLAVLFYSLGFRLENRQALVLQ